MTDLPSGLDHFAGVMHVGGRITLLQIQYDKPGITSNAAKAEVSALLPADATLISQTTKNACEQLLLRSAQLAQALSGDGYVGVQLNSPDNANGSFAAYNSMSVNYVIVLRGTSTFTAESC